MDGNKDTGKPVRLTARIDLVGGMLVCALAALVWYGSLGLPVGELRYFGPGFMPRLCAAALLLGGLVLLYRGVTQPDSAAERLVLAKRGPLMVGLAILLFALTIRGYPVGPLRAPQLGLLVAGPLAIIVSGFGGVEARLRELVVLALCLSGLGALVFVEFLGVPLPVLPMAVERALPAGWGIDWPPRIAALAFVLVGLVLAWRFGFASRGSEAANEGRNSR